ncbi:MAG: tail fiber domain-containing protein, partial [Patescibacteria group bacterium]|nr:tail fiber domain-containing protein [Patescibacteria group bacterium]
WSGTTQGLIGTYTNTDLRLITNGTSKVTITADGNVGVGTTGPEGILHVESSGYPVSRLVRTSTDTNIDRGVLDIVHDTTATMADGFGSSLALSGEDDDATNRVFGQVRGYRDGADTEGALGLLAGTNGAEEFVTVINTGNVGIGTTGPSQKLEIKDGNLQISGTTGASSRVVLGDTTYGGGIIQSYSNSGYSNLNLQSNLYYNGSGWQYYKEEFGSWWSQMYASATKANDYAQWSYRDPGATADTGSSVFSLRSNGNVGIGIASPTFNASYDRALHVHGATGLGAGIHMTDSTSGSAASDGTNIFQYGTDNYYINYETGKIRFYTGGGERFTISSNGNVGIGTTNPPVKFDIRDDTQDTKLQIHTENHDPYFRLHDGGKIWAMMIDQSDNHKFHITQGGYGVLASDTPVMSMTTNGNVGIGTTVPGANLEVKGSSSSDLVNILIKPNTNNHGGIEIDSNGSYQGNIRFLDDGELQWQIRALDSGLFQIYGWGTPGELVNFTSGGNVGIGTTNPDQKLHVSGGLIELDNTYGIQIESSSGVNQNAISLASNNILSVGGGSGTDKVYIDAAGGSTELTVVSGYVGVGTTAPTYRLMVNGEPAANGYTAWTNYSDRRLKENITNLITDENISILDKLTQLRPVTFNYNNLTGYDEETRNRRISGFIAQELQEVFPQMVGEIELNGETYLDTNLSDLPLYLVKSTQELSEIVFKQSEEIKELRDMVKGLQIEIKSLKN